MDLKDKKIIYHLDKNSRASYQEIAKEVRLTKASVMNRIRKLQESGILQQFTTIIDTPLLGYMAFEVHLQHRNVTLEDKKKILNFLTKIDEVQSVTSYRVEFDWAIIIISKDINGFQEAWWKIHDFLQPYTDRTRIAILAKHERYSRKYLVPQTKEPKQIIQWGKIGNEKIDEIDQKILQELSKNARISLTKIGQRVSLSSSSILHRIRSLEKRKIIKGYSIRINIRKLGYKRFRVMMSLDSNKQRKKIRDWLTNHPSVVQQSRYVGGDDIEFSVEVPEFKDLDAMLNNLREGFGKNIIRIKFAAVLQNHKLRYLPTFCNEKIEN